MRFLLLTLVWLLLPHFMLSAEPNILIIMADDCTYTDLPINGGKNAKTPHINALAKQGLVFEQAYLGMAMCGPCRAELYTGCYPLRNGCAWNHGTARSTTKSLPHYLGQLGYRVGLAGKQHIKPRTSYPFEYVSGFDANCVRSPTRPHDLSGAKSFITRDQNQPFCLVVALTEPHVPWVMGDASQYPPKKLALPPNFADTLETRRSFSNYLAEITYMDSQVGELLHLLDETNNRDKTLVLFTSEQGAQFPGNKWTNWDGGLHTSLVARWPGKITPDKRTTALVQYADVIPTLLDIAGSTPDSTKFDGTSFSKVLLGESQTHREFAYGMHNNYPEGPAYPIRSITNGQWRYIRNLTPEATYIEKHLMGKTIHNSYWQSWIWTATEKPRSRQLVERYLHRPAEELYQTSQDRYELTNLAKHPSYAEIRKKLSDALDAQLADQKDPGIPLDTPEAHRAASELKPLFPGKS